MNPILSYYSACLTILFLLLSINRSGTAQAEISIDTTGWRDIEPSADINSVKILKKVYSYSKEWTLAEKILLYSKLYNIGKESQNDTLITIYGEKLGSKYRELDSISSSLTILQHALSASVDLKTKNIALNSLGGLHLKIKDYEGALDYFFQAMHIAKEMNNGTEAYILANISEIYSTLSDHENAIKYLKYSIGYSEQLTSPEKEYSLIFDYSALAYQFYEANLEDSTDAYIQLTLDEILKIDTLNYGKFKDTKFAAYSCIAEINIERGITEQAQYFISLAEQHAQEYYLSSIYVLKAKLAILNKKYTAALSYLNRSIIKEEYYGNDEVIQLRAKCLENLGQYRAASRVKDDYIRSLNEEFTTSRLKFASFANIKFETLKKNEEINALKNEQKINELRIKNQRYMVYSSTALILFFLGISYTLWQLYKNRKNLNAKLETLVTEKTENLQRANQELKILNYVASHDLKEPIRTIRSFTDLIHNKLDKKNLQELLPYFSYVQSSTDHIYNLVENIGSYHESSSISNIDYETVDLTALVDEIRITIDHFLQEKNGQIKTTALPRIKSNNTILSSVIKNLVENGIKFNTSEVPTVTIDYRSNGSTHIISVSDNGIGIEEKFQELIFTSFKKLHNSTQYKGTGLGLSITKILVEKIGGKIALTSSKDKGSKFDIIIPIK